MFVFVFDFCLFIFWLCWVFTVVQGFSLVEASGGYSLCAVHGPLIAVASLVQQRLLGAQASAAAAYRC